MTVRAIIAGTAKVGSADTNNTAWGQLFQRYQQQGYLIG